MLVTYPALLRQLGAEALGLYLLGTSFGGLLTFLDLGFSAATVKFVAEDAARGALDDAGKVIRASIGFYTVVGGVGAILVWVASPWLVEHLAIAPALRADALQVFRLSGFQFWASFTTTVFLSVFKGLRRFELSSSLTTLLSVLTYGGALAGLAAGLRGVVGVTAIALLANLMVMLAAGIGGLRVCHQNGIILARATPGRATYRRIGGFSWAVVLSSLAGILHAQVQRLLIGSLLGPQLVTSFHLGVWGPAKVNGATLALSEPLFPRAAAQTDGLQGAYYRMLGVTALLSLVALLPVMLVPERLFGWWFQGHPPAHVADIARVIAIGLFCNAIGHPAHHMLNGRGRPWVNTLFALASPVVLYATLQGLRIVRGSLGVMDFAWATSLSLMTVSLLYLATFEWQMYQARLALSPGGIPR